MQGQCHAQFHAQYCDIWAVVKADDLSWFQGSTANAVSPLQIRNITEPDRQHSLIHDAVAQADRQWLLNMYTCLYTELSLELHLYGLDCEVDTASKRSSPGNALLRSATDAAVKVAMDSICGPSANFLATTDKAGKACSLAHCKHQLKIICCTPCLGLWDTQSCRVILVVGATLI